MGNKIVAIIPARSGSKGIKGKNIKDLDGKPLMAYSIEVALNSGVFDDVIVSTDSEEYARIARKYGAYVPFLRSEFSARDEATNNEVIEEVILNLKELGKEYDAVMILQPTSPLREQEDIIEAIKLFEEKDANSVISMCECEHSPVLCKQLDSEKKLDGFLSEISKVRRQDLSKYYRLNGSIYLLKVEYFLKYKDFYKEDSYAFIMEKKKSIDIDDIDDFKFAEFLIKSKLEAIK